MSEGTICKNCRHYEVHHDSNGMCLGSSPKFPCKISCIDYEEFDELEEWRDKLIKTV